MLALVVKGKRIQLEEREMDAPYLRPTLPARRPTFASMISTVYPFHLRKRKRRFSENTVLFNCRHGWY